MESNELIPEPGNKASCTLPCSHTGSFPKASNQKEFDKILAKNKDLIEIAMPVMRYLYNTFIGTETIIMLSDSDDNVLEIIGDKRIIDFFAGHNLIKGAHWGEKIVGTNGMTLARLLDSPVQTLAQDHYCIHHTTPLAFPRFALTALIRSDCVFSFRFKALITSSSIVPLVTM
jgi:transcriptional regulator of acetoin/glycerol metabolism